MTEQVEKKKKSVVKVTIPSKKLLALLDSLKLDFKKLQQRVDEIFKLAREEGFPDSETGDMIRMRMDGEYSEATIRRVLPKTAKSKTVATDNAGAGGRHKKAIKIIASEHGNVTADEKISITDPHRLYKELLQTERKINKELREENERLQKENAELKKKIAELERGGKK